MATFAITERGTFRRCKRQAVLTSKNGQHLTKLFGPLNLSLGTMWHRTQQLWIEQPDKPLTAHAMDASVEARDKAARRYHARVGVPPSDNEMATTYDSISMLLAMAEMYAIKYKDPLPADYRLLRAEQKIEVEVPGTEHVCELCAGDGKSTAYAFGLTKDYEPCRECHGTGTALHKLSGRLDGLIQHESGRIDILERKTYGQRPRLDKLNEMDQFLGYKYLVRRLGINQHLDSCIFYDGMWRRDKIPRGKTFDDMFSRHVLSRNQHEMEEFERMLPIELNDMAALYKTTGGDASHPAAYINRPWNGCGDCTMMHDLCIAMSRGEQAAIDVMLATKYTERDDDVEETEDVTTDDD